MKDIPPMLYKYRDWHNSYNQRSLTETEVYFASPNEFNDPFDCSIPFSYDEKDLTPENIFRKYLQMGKRKHPDWDDQQLHEEAFEYQKRDLIHDLHHIEDQSTQRSEDFSKAFGILSLTSENNNFLMWSHYSNSHSGFCIGYNSEKLFAQTGGRLQAVFYEDEFPKFGLFDDASAHATKYAYFKSRIWAYEKEFRLMRPHYMKKVTKLTEDTVEEIVLGNKMEHGVKLSLLELIEKKYPSAKVFETQLHSKKFDLTLNRIR